MEQVDKIITSKEEKTTIKQSFFLYMRIVSAPHPPRWNTFLCSRKKERNLHFLPCLVATWKKWHSISRNLYKYVCAQENKSGQNALTLK